MGIEESITGEMRRTARQHLPERAFLKRDRGDFLWVTNAPAFDGEFHQIPGFITTRRGGLLCLLPDESWVRFCEDQLPRDFLSKAFARFCGQDMDLAALKCFADGIKLLEGGASMDEARIYEQKLRQRAALALRGACPSGALYACALLNAQLKTTEKNKRG